MKHEKESIKDSDLVYILPNVGVECLFDKWYAWAYLMNPATAALNVKNRHLEIINSFINNPETHMEAIKDPKMLGGPFMDYDKARLNEIITLKKNTLESCKDLLELSQAILDLNTLLEKEAVGYSMNPLYAKVPDILKGLVELYYDLNNNPSYRFFEELLYESKYYKESLQSIKLFKVQDDDSRSFVLSTPSLPDSDSIHLNMPFKSEEIDVLFNTSGEPKKMEDLKKIMGIAKKDEDLFKSFFTKNKPEKYKKYEGDGTLVRYFGHACVFIETEEVSILVDPVISYSYESDISRYTYSDLPETIDYVLITHNHQDHINFETLMRIRHKIKHIIVPKSNGGSLQDLSLKTMFKRIGFKSIIELGDLERLEFNDCLITGIPFLGEHADLDIRSKLCYLVELKNKFKIMFVADSCNIENNVYRRVSEIYGKIDVLFLGMECDGAPLSWLYGPLLNKPLDWDRDQTRRLAGSNFEEGKNLIELFQPQNVFVYAMGLEPWLTYMCSIKYTDESRPITESNRLIEYCINKGIDGERLYGEKIIEYNYSDEIVI